MADIHVVTQPCIGVKSGECIDVCPVDCIHPNRSNPAFEGAEMVYIDPEVCIGCGACEPVCPVVAIFERPQVPEKWQSYIELNAEHFRKPPEGPGAEPASTPP